MERWGDTFTKIIAKMSKKKDLLRVCEYKVDKQAIK